VDSYAVLVKLNLLKWDQEIATTITKHTLEINPQERHACESATIETNTWPLGLSVTLTITYTMKGQKILVNLTASVMDSDTVLLPDSVKEKHGLLPLLRTQANVTVKTTHEVLNATCTVTTKAIFLTFGNQKTAEFLETTAKLV
jgi:hypothetical protein